MKVFCTLSTFFVVLQFSIFQYGNPGCAPGMAHILRTRLIAIDETFAQSHWLFLQLGTAQLQGWVYFTHLFVSIFQPHVCAGMAHTFGLVCSNLTRHLRRLFLHLWTALL